jgi:hypothetical protein
MMNDPLSNRIAAELGHAISNLGYPVGMGAYPNPDTMQTGAQSILKMIADENGVTVAAIEAGVVKQLVEALKEAVEWDSHDSEGFPAVWLADAQSALALIAPSQELEGKA